METTDLEFEFFLARELRMTVQAMREQMSSEEYVQWTVFYGRKAQREQMASLRSGR